MLKALNSTLEAPEHDELLLFAFKALPGKSVDIRLDKVSDCLSVPPQASSTTFFRLYASSP